MISSNEIEAIIFEALGALNEERPADEQIDVSAKTPLFGASSELDSLEFVSVITDVEVAINSGHGLELSLADDRALERTESPYASVESLRDYVLELAGEQ